MNITNFIELISGVAIFLFGMVLMGEGLKQVAGNRLEVILYKLTGKPLRGLLFGAGITTVIQSSSATSVMVVGFVNSGIMKVRQAIPIVLGAIFGTSITGWVICLSGIDAGSGLLTLFSSDTLTCLAASLPLPTLSAFPIMQSTWRKLRKKSTKKKYAFQPMQNMNCR